MKHTSESRHKICIFQTSSTMLKCQFCLEKLSSFCMTEFVIANSTVLPKGRAWNSPLHFSCILLGTWHPHTAHSVCLPEPEGSSLLPGESWHLGSTCRKKAELLLAAEAGCPAEPAELPTAEKRESVPLLLAPLPHHFPCMPSTYLDPLLCPFTHQNGKTWPLLLLREEPGAWHPWQRWW